MNDAFDRIKAIIVEQLGVDEDKVTLEARFQEDLEADSLDLVELIMAFEDEFDAEISDDEAQQIKTVGQAVDYLKQRLAEEG
jgi:acyl carrier protein